MLLDNLSVIIEFSPVVNFFVFSIVFLTLSFLLRFNKLIGFMVYSVVAVLLTIAGTKPDLNLFPGYVPTIYDHFFANLGGDIFANLLLITCLDIIESNHNIQVRTISRCVLCMFAFLFCAILTSNAHLIAEVINTLSGWNLNADVFYNFALEILVIPLMLILLNIVDLIFCQQKTPQHRAYRVVALFLLTIIIVNMSFSLFNASTNFLALRFVLIGSLLTTFTANDIFMKRPRLQEATLLLVIYIPILTLVLMSDLADIAKVSLLTELLSATVFVFMKIAPRSYTQRIFDKISD